MARSSSALEILLGEALVSISTFNGSESARAIASSARDNAGCGETTPGERALSGVESRSVTEVDSSSCLQDGNRSGGQVVRAEISWMTDVAFKLGVLSLGVGIETS
jgi:hypothetical protein